MLSLSQWTSYFQTTKWYNFVPFNKWLFLMLKEDDVNYIKGVEVMGEKVARRDILNSR